jgi:hypothetical protein
MKIWRVDSSIYEPGCSELFVTKEAAEAEVNRVKSGWHLAKTFITECEDIWNWIDDNIIIYIENLIGEYTERTDENNWHYLVVNSTEFYERLDKFFCETSIDDYSIIMEHISETDEGRLYVLSISWYLEGELNHVVEFVVT